MLTIAYLFYNYSATLFSGNHHIADITDIADIADILQEDTGLERDKLRWLVSDRKKWKEPLTQNSFQTSSKLT